MAKLSTIEIAKRQRHLLLLGKVKGNKPLSRAELLELKRYESQAAGKMTAKARLPSTKPSVKPSKTRKKKKTSKRAKKKRRKAKQVRLPIEEAEVRRLGLECENRTEANAAIRTRKSLSELFKKYPQLSQAWDRGRFMRNLRGLARTGVSISEASKKLGFASGRALRTMLDEDEEAGDLWVQTQLGVYIEIKTALVEAAKEGKADAVRAVEIFLLDEKEHPGFDPSRITTPQLTEITGRARQRIHEWYTKFGLPRNSDNTFDLSIFLGWFEGFIIKKTSAGKEAAAELDPLKAMKAEKLKVDLASHRNELLDRTEVIISLVSWAQHIISFCERGVEELSRLCSSQPREKIAEIQRRFFRDLHTETGKIPRELRLPAAKERELVEFLKSLKPHDDR